MFPTPAEVAAMEVMEFSKLLHSIKATLVEFGSAAAPSEGALLPPVFDKPPACTQHVPGYGTDGVFDPETLGAIYIVSKETGGVIQTNNSNATWFLALNPQSRTTNPNPKP